MVGVFIDTFVVLTLNALVVISTLYTSDGILAGGYTGAATEIVNKTNLTQTAFGTVFGAQAGAIFVAIALFFFAFSTILSWNLFGKINVAYLFGEKATKVYTVIALLFIFLGTLASNDLVWELSDMFNNLMVIPNALALFALSGIVVTIVKSAARNPCGIGASQPVVRLPSIYLLMPYQFFCRDDHKFFFPFPNPHDDIPYPGLYDQSGTYRAGICPVNSIITWIYPCQV